MPPRNRTPLPFGAGLDRESGVGLVQPTSFADLRNCHLHEGKVVLRGGFTAAGVGDFGQVDVLLTGHALRSDAIGIVAGYNRTTEAVHVYRTSPDLTVVEHLGEWENDKGWGSEVPRIIMASAYGRVFMAHDTPATAQRAPTIYYDGVEAGEVLKTLTSDWADGTSGESVGESAESVDPDNWIRFRGVVRHQSYLFGWGFGTNTETRPEVVRVSLPADPTTFEINAYFIAGDRNDDVIGCAPVGGFPGLLKVFKQSETYDITGSDRATFAITLADPRYGLVAGRALVQIGNVVIAWSEEGPRLWTARGDSEPLEIPLGLEEWEPTDLVDEGERAYAFAHFQPVERVAWFHFNRRVYALTARVPGRWRWSYQELPFDAYGAMTFYEGETRATAPTGYPAFNATDATTNPTVPGGTFVDLGWRNFSQVGDETVEVWLAEGVSGSGGTDEPGGGAIRAFTNFSEFGLGAGQPAGLTVFSPNHPDTWEVADDAEGRYIEMRDWANPQSGSGGWAVGIDAFDGIGNVGEILMRFWVPGAGNQKQIGPALTIAGDDVDHNTLNFAAGQYQGDFFGNPVSLLGLVTNGSPSSEGQGAIQVAEEAGVWAWMRYRRLPPGDGNQTAVKTWFGDLADEPAGWDHEVGGFAAGAGTGLGWGMIQSGADSPQRVAFWSYTSDPLAHPPIEPDEVPSGELTWFLADSFAVSSTFQQNERVTGLDPGKEYNVALRYRRGLTYNAGAENTDDPSAWPSISRGSFTASLDNPTISSAVWARTGAAAEGVTLTIVPDPDNADEDIEVYRDTVSGGTPTLLTTLSGPHADPLEYEDTTVAGETIYYYSVRHVTGTADSPYSPETRVWSGPADIPGFSYKSEFVEGYNIGFTIDAVGPDVELHDTYDDAGGVEAYSLRDTLTPATTSDEFSVTLLANVPPEGVSFGARMRVKETAFTTDDFGEFGDPIPINVEGSEFE